MDIKSDLYIQRCTQPKVTKGEKNKREKKHSLKHRPGQNSKTIKILWSSIWLTRERLWLSLHAAAESRMSYCRSSWRLSQGRKLQRRLQEGNMTPNSSSPPAQSQPGRVFTRNPSSCKSTFKPNLQTTVCRKWSAESSTAAARQPLMWTASDPSTVSFWNGRRSQLAAAWEQRGRCSGI
jgi:hypothetical protein